MSWAAGARAGSACKFKLMPVYSLRTVQKIPVPLEKAWDFFSHPANLAEMTPAYLNLRFTNELFGEAMYPGQVITYRVKPVLGIPMFWMTEIAHVDPLRYFVDEQRTGPYRIWHHQHHFKSIDGGVEMTDIVHYQPPLGWLGAMANSLLIKGQLKTIFDYRYQKVEELFGKWQG
jgi:ligand-binding SRPBCC domain-containing protein